MIISDILKDVTDSQQIWNSNFIIKAATAADFSVNKVV